MSIFPAEDGREALAINPSGAPVLKEKGVACAAAGTPRLKAAATIKDAERICPPRDLFGLVEEELNDPS
jgi:hypothetical protein